MSITFEEIEPKLEFTVLEDEVSVGVIAINATGSEYSYYPDDAEAETPEAVLNKLAELNN